MLKFSFARKNQIKNLPATPGVYVFKKNALFLYIGKAVNIKERVKNHFQSPAFKDNIFIPKAEKIGFIATGSEIEALLLEARLIKKFQPKYNTQWKDSKNYFYIAITNEQWPRVFVTHQNSSQKSKIKNQKYKPKVKSINYLGPFVDGKALRQTLKTLRRVFPFRTCRTLPKRSCLYKELGLCEAPCEFKSQKAKFKIVIQNSKVRTKYQRNIQNLANTLHGGKIQVIKNLQKEMLDLSKKQEFEKANEIKNQVAALENVLQGVKLLAGGKEFHPFTESFRELQKVLKLKNGIKRIEAYDISNIQGKQATGSMVVFINGEPDKNEYRKFKIKTENKPNDIAMLREVLERRLKHSEWPLPEVILIDGGIGQLNAATKTVYRGTSPVNLIIIALAKRHNELFIERKEKPILLKNLPNSVANLILRIRDEAHRFAIKYHKTLRSKRAFV